VSWIDPRSDGVSDQGCRAVNVQHLIGRAAKVVCDWDARLVHTQPVHADGLMKARGSAGRNMDSLRLETAHLSLQAVVTSICILGER
jgi:hypothetical protein